ncbi:hypothetical protein L9F63_012301, partial [Diploptera punctata]
YIVNPIYFIMYYLFLHFKTEALLILVFEYLSELERFLVRISMDSYVSFSPVALAIVIDVFTLLYAISTLHLISNHSAEHDVNGFILSFFMRMKSMVINFAIFKSTVNVSVTNSTLKIHNTDLYKNIHEYTYLKFEYNYGLNDPSIR